MPELVPCLHKECIPQEMKCENCAEVWSYSMTSFDELEAVTSDIVERVVSSGSSSWGKERIRFFINLITGETVPNAVEHGILGIGMQEKRDALRTSFNGYTGDVASKWRDSGIPVTISFCANPQSILLGVHDSGGGFNSIDYSSKSLIEDDILQLSGKGIFIMKGFGVQLYWNEKGNSIVCAVPDKALSIKAGKQDKGGRRLIALDEIYRVDIKQFDAEHIKLFGLLDKLFMAVHGEESNETTGRVIDELINYTVTHFKNEEDVMEKTGYPDYEYHKKEHELLASKVKDVQQRFHGNGEGISVEIMRLLTSWIKNHISKSDKDYSPFLASKGYK